MRTGWMWNPKSVLLNAKNDTQKQGDNELIDLSAEKKTWYTGFWWCGARKHRDICSKGHSSIWWHWQEDRMDIQERISSHRSLWIQNCSWIAWIAQSTRWRTFHSHRASLLENCGWILVLWKRTERLRFEPHRLRK